MACGTQIHDSDHRPPGYIGLWPTFTALGSTDIGVNDSQTEIQLYPLRGHTQSHSHIHIHTHTSSGGLKSWNWAQFVRKREQTPEKEA